MTLAQACTRILGALAILVALSLIPSAAMAHGAHAGHGVHGVSAGLGHHHHAGAPRAATPADVAPEQSRQAAVTLAPAGPDQGGASCVAGCCAMGSGCCPGLILLGDGLLTDPPIADRVRPRHPGIAFGIDPEALPEPPRPFV